MFLLVVARIHPGRCVSSYSDSDRDNNYLDLVSVSINTDGGGWYISWQPSRLDWFSCCPSHNGCVDKDF